MARLESVQDLAKLREESHEQLRKRISSKAAILVGAGTCGIAAGATETLEAFRQELAARNIDAHVGTVGCIGMCANEPLVDVRIAGGAHVLYANITADRVARLVEEHLLQGKPVREWTICRLAAV